MKPRRPIEIGETGAAVLVFLFGALALAFPWLSGRVTIPWDAKAHFQPQFSFLAHSLHHGDSPFWTHNVFTGSPQVADPQSLIFAPFFLVAAAIFPEPSFIVEDALIFAMLTMGGLALILYFRDRGWAAAGGLVAALAFAFGGSACWRIQHTGQVMSLAWFPVTLLLLSRALDRRSARYGAAAGLVAAFMVLGRDQVALLCVMILSAYALFRLFADDDDMLSAARPLLAGAGVGVAVIALPLLFTLMLAADSNRPAIDLDGAFKGSLPPGSFLTLISANLFGTDGPLKDFWGPPSSAFGTSDIYLARNMTALYLGALPILSLFAAFRPRLPQSGEIRFFAAAAALLALYALGRFTPAFQLMFHIPGVDLYRRPADASFPLCALLALLGGYAFHLIASGAAKPRPLPLAAAAVGLLALCAAVAIEKGRFAQATPALIESATMFAAAFGVLLAAPKLAPRRGAALLVLAGAALTLDLAIGNEPNESTALPPAQFDVLREATQNETIALLKRRLAAGTEGDRRDRIELAAIDFHWPNASLTHDLDHDLGYNPIRLKLFEDVTGAGDHVALPEQRQFSKLYPSYRSPLSDLMGLRFIATGVPIETIDKSLKGDEFPLIARTKDAYVYENPGALPRVLAPSCAMRVDFAKMIAEGGWPEVDFRETVLVEDPPICHNHVGQNRAARATLLSYHNTEVLIEVNAPDHPAYVVLNDIWHPYWFAAIDGEAAPVLRANVMFRAVAVPEGRHLVRFSFEPLRGLIQQLSRR